MAKSLELRPHPLCSRQAQAGPQAQVALTGLLWPVKGSGSGVVDTDSGEDIGQWREEWTWGGRRGCGEEGGGMQFLASGLKEGHRTDSPPGGTVLSPSTDTCQLSSVHRAEGSSCTGQGTVAQV